jgi:F-type H+-transporting ATPase subunit a
MFALPPLAAETIFHIGNFPITNTYINSSLVTIGFIIFGFVLSRAAAYYYSSSAAPKGILNFFESVLEFLLKYFDQVTGDRKKTVKFLPIVGTLFFFILVSNWIGLLPGVGSIGRYELHRGVLELIPVFRPANTDLNMTLAMAVLAVIVSHVIGIVAIGFFKYANKFIKLGDLWHAVKSGKPMSMLIALVEFFVGFIEIFSEIAKMVSLSLRLFGNIFAGEVLMTVLASLIAYIVPLPFIALELLVGLVQAVVFSMLALVYLTIATTEVPEHHGNTGDAHDLEATPMA